MENPQIKEALSLRSERPSMDDGSTTMYSTARLIPFMLRELENRGYDRSTLLEQAGIKWDNQASPNMVSPSECSRFFNYICSLLSSEATTLPLQAIVTKDVTDMLLHCVITCDNLACVIQRSIVYCELVKAIGLSLQLVQGSEFAELRIELDRPMKDTPSLLLLLASMSIFYQLFSWITAVDLPVSELGLCCDKPTFSPPLGGLPDVPLFYQQRHSRIVFPVSCLTLPVARNSEQLKQVIDHFPLDLSVVGPKGSSLSSQIETLIQASLRNQKSHITFETVTQLVNLSPATLRRRLRGEGTSYSDILNRCRMSYASHALRTTSRPMKCIALQLGFSDDRAFRRAVKRWSGSTPTELRTGQSNS